MPCPELPGPLWEGKGGRQEDVKAGLGRRMGLGRPVVSLRVLEAWLPPLGRFLGAEGVEC